MASRALAGALQISPVTVDFSATWNATLITLRNAGDEPIHGQVRVFQWDQQNGIDILTPSRELIASPPLVHIEPRSMHLIRLLRRSRTPLSSEQSYRLLIDELPAPSRQRDPPPAPPGISIRLRYSIPVFVEPDAAAAAALAQTAQKADAAPFASPALSWRLERVARQWWLLIDNQGTRRAQIGATALLGPSGMVYPISKGLLGYALAGRQMQWQIPLPDDATLSGRMLIRTMVNAVPTDAEVIIQQAR
jgi:fimbrial chaperone protein